MVLVRYACMVNGADEIAITNLDGLDGLDTIKLCNAYKLDGKVIHYPPSTIAEIERLDEESAAILKKLKKLNHLQKSLRYLVIFVMKNLQKFLQCLVILENIIILF